VDKFVNICFPWVIKTLNSEKAPFCLSGQLKLFELVYPAWIRARVVRKVAHEKMVFKDKVENIICMQV
jgi:hypothetical protein